MSRKILYSLVVVAMLVMAFGVKGVGVQTAAAAAGWNDLRANVTDTGLPFYGLINLNSQGAADPGNLGGCAVAPSFGAYQTHLLDSDTPAAVTYLRVRVKANNAADYVQNSWAVRVSANAAGLPELGCALNNTSGVIDFVVALPAGTGVVVTLATNGVFIPNVGDAFTTLITRGTNASGGLLIDMLGDCGGPALRIVEATNVADANDGNAPVAPATDIGNGRYYEGYNIDTWGFWLDVPAGTYNLGVADSDSANAFAAYYPAFLLRLLPIYPFYRAPIRSSH